MSILDTLLSKIGYTKAARPEYPDWTLARAGVEQWTIPDGSTYERQAELYRLVSWIQIAVSIPSQIAALTPLNVMKVEGEKLVDVPNHPLEMLLMNPNPLQSRSEFLVASFLFRLLTGNCYWYVNALNENAEPTELWLIPPAQIKVIPDGKSFIVGYDYDPGDGQLIRLEPWQVIHFKGFHPSSMFVGLSKSEAVAVDARADMATSAYNARLYGNNNGRIPGIIAFADMIPDPDWKLVQQSIKEASKTQNNMLLRGAGKGGVEWLRAAGTVKEMETYQGRQFTKEEIYSIFAPGLASTLDVNATEANSKTGKATLIGFCVHPMQVEMAEKISQCLLPRYAGGKFGVMVAQFDDIRVTDRMLMLSEIGTASTTHTVNEIREKFYQDDPLDDERGELFPGQVQPPQPEQPEAPEQQPEAQPEQPTPEAPEQTPVTEDAEEEETEAPEVAAEKAKWMRKALNALKAGKPASVDFQSEIIPSWEMDKIRQSLDRKTTPDEVRAVFAAKSRPVATPEQILEMMRLAIEAIKSAPPGHEFYGNQWVSASGGDGGRVYDRRRGPGDWGGGGVYRGAPAERGVFSKVDKIAKTIVEKTGYPVSASLAKDAARGDIITDEKGKFWEVSDVIRGTGGESGALIALPVTGIQSRGSAARIQGNAPIVIISKEILKKLVSPNPTKALLADDEPEDADNDE